MELAQRIGGIKNIDWTLESINVILRTEVPAPSRL
jgi:hypothetical protein